jgi:hypothetical protein
MSGYRNSCWGRRAWKANYFFIWGVEEHMIPCLQLVLTTLLSMNETLTKIGFVLADVPLQAEIHWSTQGMDEEPWGAQELFHWASFSFRTSGGLWGIFSYNDSYLSVRLVRLQTDSGHITSFVAGTGDATEVASFLCSWIIEVHKLMDLTPETKSKLFCRSWISTRTAVNKHADIYLSVL